MHGFTVDPDVLATAGDPLTDIASALVNQGNLADWTLRRAASVPGEAALAAALLLAAGLRLRAPAEVARARAALPRFERMSASGPAAGSGVEGALEWGRQAAGMVDVAGEQLFRRYLSPVAGYVRGDGREVGPYLRWRRGLAGAMN